MLNIINEIIGIATGFVIVHFAEQYGRDQYKRKEESEVELMDTINNKSQFPKEIYIYLVIFIHLNLTEILAFLKFIINQKSA